MREAVLIPELAGALTVRALVALRRLRVVECIGHQLAGAVAARALALSEPLPARLDHPERREGPLHDAWALIVPSGFHGARTLA